MIDKICPRIDGRAFLLTVLLFIGSRAGLTQSSPANTDTPAAAHMRALNNSLLKLHGQMQHADSNSARVLRGQAATVIAQRSAALAKLIQFDPHAALTFAFSPELLADLTAKFPQSAAHLETHTTVIGTVEHWTADYQKSSFSWWSMNAGGRRLNMFFAHQEPANLKTGDVLQATGVVAESQMAVESSVTTQSSAVLGSTTSSHTASRHLPLREQWSTFAFLAFGLVALPGLGKKVRPARARLLPVAKQLGIWVLVLCLFVLTAPPSYAQNSCSTMGVQNVAVLLVTFPGVTPPANITAQSVYDMFFSTTGPSLDGYWRETSYGQTSAAGSVFGWYTLDSTYANCGRLDLLRDAAIAAASNAGVPIQTYNRVFIVTADFGCGWTGLALNGCMTLNSPGGSFTASASFLNASWQGSQMQGAENAAHEGGHNMGLAHAQSLTFGAEPLGALGTVGTIAEYGDPYSDMSCSNSGHYAAPHKAEFLNWIATGTNYQVVQSSGTWTLQPLENNPAGLVALKVQRGTGNNAWLWIEYRRPIGIYESTWSPGGALIHYEDANTGAHTQMLDFTPITGSLYDGALLPGSTWADPYSNLSLSVQSADGNGLTIAVNYGMVPCTSAQPTVALSPLDPSIYPGSAAAYNLSITNNDSSGCSATSFAMSSSQPAGWPTSFSASSVSLGPGKSATLTMTKTGPLGTPPATYLADANASNGTYVGTGTANLTVMSPPAMSVSLSVPSSVFTLRSTVPISAAVLNGGTPASGANVTFTLTGPSGNRITQSATTGSSGTATWNYKLGPRSVAGTYNLSAQAALSSGSRKAATTQSVASNTVSFVVQ